MEREEILGKVPIFSGLHRRQLKRLSSLMVPRNCNAGEVIFKEKDQAAGFFVITAGKVDAHPGDIFDAPAIGACIDDLKFYYDLIVVDSPPVIPVSDPMLLAAEVDGMLLVVIAGATPREVITRATQILSTNGTKLLGLIMNDLNETLPYYYKYSSYSYEYGPQSAPGAAATPQPAGSSKSGKATGNGSKAGGKSQSGRRSVSNQ